MLRGKIREVFLTGPKFDEVEKELKILEKHFKDIEKLKKKKIWSTKHERIVSKKRFEKEYLQFLKSKEEYIQILKKNYIE